MLADVIIMEVSKKIFKTYLLPNIVKPVKKGMYYIYRNIRTYKN